MRPPFRSRVFIRGASFVAAWFLLNGCHRDTESTPIASCTALDPGPARLRRLTRFELGHVLADSLGVDPILANRMPPDEVSLGYDNIAAAYSVSASHATKTLEMAEEAAAAFIATPAAVRAVADCDPLLPDDAGTCVSGFIARLGGRLWRRPLSDDEIAAFVALDSAAAEGEPAVGLTAVVAALLQSPDFIYRPEPIAPNAAPGQLSPSALANRLSFLLTSTAPDDLLLQRAAVADSDLATPAALSAEVERLLAQPRALESFQHFVNQWWELGALSSVQKDTALFRTWTATTPAAFAQETNLFLEAAWRDGPTLDRLFTGTTTFVNDSLAGFYGDPIPTGVGFQPVVRDRTRASGLFTQGAFLATHAKVDQTSPVQRGRFVRTQIFCAPPPPPPADIVITPPTVDPRLSTRERFAQHTAEPRCAGCHTLMDPIGFAFEHFDATGRWRDVDGGKTVDASGMLTGTDVDGSLQGVNDLSARIVKSAQVRSCVALQWFRWAFGRDQETADDACTIGTLATALLQARGDLRALPRATVTTATFLKVRHDSTGGAP